MIELYELRGHGQREQAQKRVEARIRQRLDSVPVVPWSESMLSHLAKVDTFLEGYFAEFGIPDMVNPPVLQTPALDSLSPDRKKRLAYSTLGHIALPTLAWITDTQTREFLQTRFAIHEKYHGSKPYILTASSQSVRLDRHGISYRNAYTALEEGLAFFALANAGGLLNDMFPAQLRNWSASIRQSVAQNNSPKFRVLVSLPPTRRESLFVKQRRLDGTSRIHCSGVAIADTLLANYLISQIPDFHILAERARILGETVAFTRALTLRFGRDLTRRVLTTPSDKNLAITLFHDLQKYVLFR